MPRTTSARSGSAWRIHPRPDRDLPEQRGLGEEEEPYLTDAGLLLVTRSVRLFAYGSLSVILVFYLTSLGLSTSQTGLLLTLPSSGIRPSPSGSRRAPTGSDGAACWSSALC